MKKTIFFLSLFCCLSSAFAGGPIVVDTVNKSGTPQKWDKDTIEWYYDDGSLSSNVNNQKVVQWIQEAFSTWSNVNMQTSDGRSVKTVALTVKQGGSIGKDINKTNYQEYLQAKEGPTVIIFDADGSIFEDLGIDKNLIIGVTAPLLSSGDGKKILRGVSILSGYLLENNRLDPDPARAEMLYRSSILHEMGHILNFDHTAAMSAAAVACRKETACVDGEFIQTMFPELKTPLQLSLARDDKITISWLYPSQVFQSEFCTLHGRIEDEKGVPLRGVNVLAQRIGEGDGLTKEDIRSFVSGVLYPGCEANSDYQLFGIVPGKKYQVLYEQLPPQYAGQSGFEPLPNPPQGFPAKAIETADGKTTVECSRGGEVIEMSVAQISTSNPCKNLKPSGSASAPPGSGGPGSSGGGCSFSSGVFNGNMAILFFVLGSFFLFQKRKVRFRRGVK